MTKGAEKPEDWLTMREKGAVLGMRLLLFVTTVFGRAPGRLLIRVIAFYYAVFHRSVRRHSRTYLERVLDHKVRFRHVYRHVLTFAQIALDRLFMVKPARARRFVVERHGNDPVVELGRQRRGALLLGAHLGSFEALRMMAADDELRMNIVGYFRNAAMVNAFLRKADPAGATRVIHIEPGTFDAALRIQRCVEAGEMVGLLADRTGLNEREAEVTFLGQPVRLPTGPYLLAAALRCPIFLAFGIYRGGKRYELFCEPFADKVVLDRKNRKEGLRQLAQRYADRLEHHCRSAPYNWFNFYDYWAPGDAP